MLAKLAQAGPESGARHEWHFSWLGNSPRIAQQSYLLVTEDDFSKASGRALSCNFLSVALRKYITTLPIFFFPLGCRVRNHTKEESIRILGKLNMQTDKLDD
jgi:hypothetical protein